jgi:hypothetical protein
MAKKAKKSPLKKADQGWLGDPKIAVLGISVFVVLVGVLVTNGALVGSNAEMGRYDAVSNQELKAAEEASAEAHAAKSSKALEMDMRLITKLYEFRRMDEADRRINLLFRMLGGAEKAKKGQPLLGLLHAQITGALGVLKQDDTLVKRGIKLAESFKEKVNRWKDRLPRPMPQSYYAALRSYHVLHSIHGSPPPPYLDDGVETSRRQESERVNASGFAGRRSSYATTNAECTVDRRDWRTLSVDRFLNEYHEAGKPVVLFGDGLLNTKAGSDWSLAGLKKEYGTRRVFVSANQVHEELYGSRKGKGYTVELNGYIDAELAKVNGSALVGCVGELTAV